MKYTLITFLTLLLTSCLKRNEAEVNKGCTDSCMTFNVRVGTDNHSSTPVKDASVELSWSRPATPFGDPGRLIAKGNTNSSGVINFEFKPQPKELVGGRYSVSIKNNIDGFQPYISYYDIAKYDTVVNAYIHLPSKATIRIIFKNFNPKTNQDYFSASPYFSGYGTQNLNIHLTNVNGGLSNPYFSGSDGGFSKVELIGTTAGNQFTYFSILRKKNGIREDLIDSVYVQKNETRIYEIEY
ncbi:MAG: hypothetical protein H7Y13_04955 [Sphingobacteriaceae bacterium]|nr:hypothetical protein [Sphingobacteriaceae bacterium]